MTKGRLIIVSGPSGSGKDTVLKKLFEKVKETKTILDSHPLVIEYYRIFSEVNEPLNYIQFKLISLFNHKGLTCEEK